MLWKFSSPLPVDGHLIALIPKDFEDPTQYSPEQLHTRHTYVVDWGSLDTSPVSFSTRYSHLKAYTDFNVLQYFKQRSLTSQNEYVQTLEILRAKQLPSFKCSSQILTRMCNFFTTNLFTCVLTRFSSSCA